MGPFSLLDRCAVYHLENSYRLFNFPQGFINQLIIIQCESWEEERLLQGRIRVEELWREDVPSAPQLLDLM
jgi:hypothetical protein